MRKLQTLSLQIKKPSIKDYFRAKEKLKAEKIPVEFPAAVEINGRLENVLTTLYLLFSEGYYSEVNDRIIRADLCLEAMRLAYLLIENERTNLPRVKALYSLMCFHASRFEARKKDNGQIVLYQEQDENIWNQELITKGAYYLHQSSQGNQLSKYHLEASIAYWHTLKKDTKEKWENILQLYNRLLQIEYSPIAALNRTFALAKANSKQEAIREAEKLQLTNNHYYFTLLGELYKDTDPNKAKDNFQKAFALAKTNGDRMLLQKKLDQL